VSPIAQQLAELRNWGYRLRCHFDLLLSDTDSDEAA
jgi:hypothetical protein